MLCKKDGQTISNYYRKSNIKQQNANIIGPSIFPEIPMVAHIPAVHAVPAVPVVAAAAPVVPVAVVGFIYVSTTSTNQIPDFISIPLFFSTNITILQEFSTTFSLSTAVSDRDVQKMLFFISA